MVCADFDAYCEAQAEAAIAYRNREDWARRCLLNIAGATCFTSDETVAGYARDIWKIAPISIEADVDLEDPEPASKRKPRPYSAFPRAAQA
jgi:hypothetical protein